MSRVPFVVVCIVLVGCGGDSASLEDFFPPLPEPTGAAQAAFAGEVTDPSQLIPGPAASGMVGDFFLKNDQVSFIIQAPTRVLGVIPQGGNIVDAVLADGSQLDHFGELGLIYLFGRTCEPTAVEVVRDGSQGGVAVLRAIGKSGNNDFINIKGIGVFRVDAGVNPDIEDDVTCATTYILAPGSTSVEVHHSLFNAGKDVVTGPLGTIADTGGETEAWTNGRGFERADITALATLSDPHPSDYVIYQGPGVAYGVIPRHDQPTVHTQALIAGVSVLINGNSALLDILDADKYFLRMPSHDGIRQQYDVVVGRDGADIDEVFRTGVGESMRPISGQVRFTGGAAAASARIGVFLDGNGNGQLDDADVDLDADGQPDDKILSYLDAGADGAYAGSVPADGALLLRAEVKNRGRSPAVAVADTVDLTIPDPIRVGFEITDATTSLPIPARLVVVGDHLAFPDKRVFETKDRITGVVDSLHAIRGTTVDLGDGADPALELAGGGTYRVYASRGTEWSIASQPVTASGDLTLELRRVNPATGYLATDWHVHQIGSPDSPVGSDDRVRGAVSAGIEMFATTDHDYVSDLEPFVDALGLTDVVRAIPGIEVTPFAYGHYNAWPMAPDDASPNKGAIDWARGMAGFAMIPDEIYTAMRARGAQMVQVNHPRGSGFTEFQAAFDRANVLYDFDGGVIFGDYENASMPYDDLRLPEATLWSDNFNGLEVWNGFSSGDTNGDGVREVISLDRVMRDWISMLSLGLVVSPAGNSDTHTSIADAVGMPRTLIRVPDDSPTALASGAAIDAVLATQAGQVPRDIVVTNGPMIEVTAAGQPALGRTIAPAAALGPVTLTVTITAPDWAEFDTLEVFANTTPERLRTNAPTVLTPLKCYTSRPLAGLAATDPCKTAALAPEAMTVQLANVPGPGNQRRFVATVTVTLDATDIVTRAGARSQDAWLVFRARGNRAVFPLVIDNLLEDATARAAVLSGDFDTMRAALTNQGVPAAAFTAPVFVDYDGGGYRAPFAL